MMSAFGSNGCGKEKRLVWRGNSRVNLWAFVFMLYFFIQLWNSVLQHESLVFNCTNREPLLSISHDGTGPTLLTVADIKRTMRLPCNYVHDGFYLYGGNAVLRQVYQSLQELDDEDVPIMVECGGHDGITKSLSLKASICLNMNTLLIEASPLNYNVLRQTRAYDITVNAALCDGDFVEMSENAANSGMTKIKNSTSGNYTTMVRCTTVDKELDQIRETLPAYLQEKIKLIYLVLDVEGHEMVAIKGIHKYPPMKMDMEIKYEHTDNETKRLLAEWESSNNLIGLNAGADKRYNWSPDLPTQERKLLFYGARNQHPPIDAATAKVAHSYQFYGE
jgi:hypothetical protein